MLLQALITSALNGGVRSASISDLLNHKEMAASYRLGVWASLRVYLGAVEKKKFYVSVDLRIAMFLSGPLCNHSHITGLQILLLLLLLLLLSSSSSSSLQFRWFRGIRVNYQALLMHHSAKSFELCGFHWFLLLHESVQPLPKLNSFEQSCSFLGQYPLWVIFRNATITSGPGPSPLSRFYDNAQIHHTW